MNKTSLLSNKIISTLIFLSLSMGLFSQIHRPIKWSFSVEDISVQKKNLIFTAKIDNGWHLYGLTLPKGGPDATQFNFTTLEGAALSGSVYSQSKLITEYDSIFDLNLNWYTGVAVFKQTVILENPKSFFIKGEVRFMGCNNSNCLPPTTETFSFGKMFAKMDDVIEKDAADSLKQAKTISNQSDQDIKTLLWTPVIDELKSFGGSAMTGGDSTLLSIFFLGLLGGLLALLTPCVWPMVPMTVSFFLKKSTSRKKAIIDSILYGLSIIVIYVGLGLLTTVLFGANTLNDLATNAIFNIIFFIILVVFAISFFGGFELMLPSSWSTKVDAKADNSKGIISILLMAFTLSLVSFSCTGPIIGTLLVQAATMGELTGPAIGMLGFSVALAVPFALFALFPTMLKQLPKSGGWLNMIKIILGFLELALALKFLSVADLAYGWGILDREVFLVLWIVIFTLLGFYLLGKIYFPNDDTPIKKVSVIRFFLATFSFAFALYMIPGLWGAPLKSISAFAPPLYTQDFNLYNNEVHAEFKDFDQGMAYAKKVNKPVLIDFSGFGCVNCRKMEATVWTNPNVKQILDNQFVLITLMVDDKTELSKPIYVKENGKETRLSTVGDKWSYLQRHKFGANAQPFYVILNSDGHPIAPAYSFDESVINYIKFLKKGISNFK